MTLENKFFQEIKNFLEITSIRALLSSACFILPLLIVFKYWPKLFLFFLWFEVWALSLTLEMVVNGYKPIIADKFK